jgi:hypothetical protein
MIIDFLLLAALATCFYSMLTGDISGVMAGLFLIYEALNLITFE